MKNHFLELFSALVLTITPPLITPISTIFYHPFSTLSLPFAPFPAPFPHPIHQPSISLLQSVIFAIFNPSNFPLKFRHIFIGSFHIYSHIFQTTSQQFKKVNKMFTNYSYCCNKFMIVL